LYVFVLYANLFRYRLYINGTLINLNCFSEVCKALNKNRGLYGRWSELQNVAVASPTGGVPLSGSATAISRTDELDWTTTELRKALRSIEWDLDDLEDTIYILFLKHSNLRQSNLNLICVNMNMYLSWIWLKFVLKWNRALKSNFGYKFRYINVDICNKFKFRF